MASYNGLSCSVEVAGENSLRVVGSDFAFVLPLSECEITYGWFASSVSVVSADGTVVLSRGEWSALGLRDRSFDWVRPVVLWVGGAAVFVAVLVVGIRLAAGPLSRLIPLQTEARWFPFAAEDNAELLVLLHEIPSTSGLHISLDSSDEVNAFAMPGGSIRVTRGLVCFARSADEVVGVIAHEVGHIHRRHVLRSLISSVGTQVILIAAMGGGTPGSLTETMISREFSVSDEREADEFAAASLLAAGMQPAVMADFFERLGKEHPVMLEAILSDHPQTASRVAYYRSLKAMPIELDPRVIGPRSLAWTNLQSACRNE